MAHEFIVFWAMQIILFSSVCGFYISNCGVEIVLHAMITCWNL